MAKSGKKLMAAMTDEPYKPKMMLDNIDAKSLPEIKKWDVGKTYTLTVEAKMTNKSEGGWSGNQPLTASFEITKINDKDVGSTDEDPGMEAADDDEY